LPLRWGGLALLAFGLQIFLIYFPEPSSDGLSLRIGFLILSYLMLFAVIARNRALPGVWVIGAGLLANFSVMMLNGGYMPITREALAQIGDTHGILGPGAGARVQASKDIVLGPEATVAGWLADIFVVPPPFPIPSVFSAGDVLIALGVFWLVQYGMRAGETAIPGRTSGH
jgi:hypothetical protein